MTSQPPDSALHFAGMLQAELACNPWQQSRGVAPSGHLSSPSLNASSATTCFCSNLPVPSSRFRRPCPCLHEREVAVVASLACNAPSCCRCRAAAAAACRLLSLGKQGRAGRPGHPCSCFLLTPAVQPSSRGEQLNLQLLLCFQGDNRQ